MLLIQAPKFSSTSSDEIRIEDTPSILVRARKHLHEALLASDSPEKTRDCLLQMSNSNHSCRTVSLLCRDGWLSLKKQQKQLMLICGLVAALLLSVSFGVTLGRLEHFEADDMWIDSHTSLEGAFILLNVLSVFFDVGALIWSLVGIVFYDLYVLDLDDMIFVGSFFRGGLVSLRLLVLSSLLLLIALDLACLISLPVPLASIVNFCLVLSLLMLVRGAIAYRRCEEKACKKYEEQSRDVYNRMIEEEYLKVVSQASGESEYLKLAPPPRSDDSLEQVCQREV